MSQNTFGMNRPSFKNSSRETISPPKRLSHPSLTEITPRAFHQKVNSPLNQLKNIELIHVYASLKGETMDDISGFKIP